MRRLLGGRCMHGACALVMVAHAQAREGAPTSHSRPVRPISPRARARVRVNTRARACTLQRGLTLQRASAATDVGPHLKALDWPASEYWSPGQRLPDFTFDFNQLIAASQLPDAVACQVLAGWASEMNEAKEVRSRSLYPISQPRPHLTSTTTFT